MPTRLSTRPLPSGPTAHGFVRWAAALAVLFLVCAACGGQPRSASSVGASPIRLAVPSPTVPPAGPAVITSRRVAGSNTVIADAEGMTVYFLSARGGHRAPICSGRCSAIWHPVLVQQGEVVPAVPGTSLKAGVTPWQGGQRQLTLNGRRLYTFTDDSAPGDVKGEGFITNQGGTTLTWHVVVLPGIPPPRTFPLTPSPSPTR